MNRRRLLRALPAAGLLSAAPWAALSRSPESEWRTLETVTRVEINDPTGAVQAWVPLPRSQDTDWFQTLENSVSGNFEKSRVIVESE